MTNHGLEGAFDIDFVFLELVLNQNLFLGFEPLIIEMFPDGLMELSFGFVCFFGLVIGGGFRTFWSGKSPSDGTG